MTLSPFSQVLFMEAAKVLNRRASARFARWQNRIGRPVPRSATDRRPDPGMIENEPGTLVEG